MQKNLNFYGKGIRKHSLKMKFLIIKYGDEHK